jgi:hypothetical protein
MFICNKYMYNYTGLYFTYSFPLLPRGNGRLNYSPDFTEVTEIFFMFCWPCISIDPCNDNQLDAPFILSLFRHSTSTFFGRICSPSSGGVLYIYSNWYMLCFSVDGLFHSNPSNRPLFYIYIIPPDDGLQICPKHVEDIWRNKLRINGASSWFSLHGSNRDVTCVSLEVGTECIDYVIMVKGKLAVGR